MHFTSMSNCGDKTRICIKKAPSTIVIGLVYEIKTNLSLFKGFFTREIRSFCQFLLDA